MKKLVMIGTTMILPLASNAAFAGTQGLITGLKTVVDSAIVLVMGLALLAFLWGLVKFIYAAGSEQKIEEGKRLMVWGIIALFVMTSIWGIVAFMQGELLTGSTPDGNIPLGPAN